MGTEHAFIRRRARDRSLGRVGLLLVAGLGPLTAQAVGFRVGQGPVFEQALPGGGWKFTPNTTFGVPAGARIVTPGIAPAGGVIVEDTIKIAGKAAAPLVVKAVQRVGAGEAAAAAARCLVGGGPGVCAVVGAAALLYAGYRIYEESGQIKEDPGVPQETVPQEVWRCMRDGNSVWNNYEYTSPLEACNALLEPTRVVRNSHRCETVDPPKYMESVTTTTLSQRPGSLTGIDFVTTTVWPCPGYAGNTLQGHYGEGQKQVAQIKRCPASVDALNPAFSLPPGLPPDADGKCKTARYNHGTIDADTAAARVVARPPADPGQLSAALKEALEKGQSAPSDLTTSGTPSQVGQPTTTTTTTTGPDGEVTTTTTTNTPTYNYHYDGDTIRVTVDNRTVTQTCVGSNMCNTTTIETIESPGDPGGKPDDKPSECEQHPDSVGCMKLGDLPTDQVPKKSATITYAAESGGGLPVGCPADRVIAGKSFSYVPICDAAMQAKPWVLVGAAFASLMLCVAALRGVA